MTRTILKQKWRILLLAVTIFLFAGFIYKLNYNELSDPQKKRTDYAKATVLEIIQDNTVADKTLENTIKGTQVIQVKITSGRNKGEEMQIDNPVSPRYQLYVKKGDKIIVRSDLRNDGQYNFSVFNFNRGNAIYAALLLFFAGLFIVGGKKGLKAILGLIFTLICVIFVLLPLMFRGYSPIPATIIILCVASAVCYMILDGVNKKTTAAFLSTLGGLLCAALLALIISFFMHVNGYNMEDAEPLMLLVSSNPIKIKGLFICGVLIAALGAIMDVAMSIASAVEELHSVNKELTTKELFTRGMNIGRDAMGTMANTLILAFAGTSLNMMILIYSYHIPYLQLLNTDYVAIEIISAICGSMGIIVTVPLVAWISSVLCKWHKAIRLK